MLVMEQRFGLSVTQVLLGKDKELSSDSIHELNLITERLLQGEPVQYILGKCEFHRHMFHVESGVLIPRPETSELVDHVIENAHTPSRILDIGTGSGCIGISLALCGHKVTALDISSKALSIAQDNAARLKANVRFIQEDILHPKDRQETWDIIVSNPPYIRMQESVSIERTVLDYEPHTALFVPDNDPLLFYRAIGTFSMKHLNNQGILWFEINRDLSEETCLLLESQGFCNVQAIKDSYQNFRFVKATHP